MRQAILWLSTRLVLILVVDFFIGGCLTSFGQTDDPALLNQQAIKLYKEGKYREAIPIAEKVLAIDEKLLGPENPSTVIAIANLALLENCLGDYAKAEPFYQQVLQIKEKLLGPTNPDTAAAMNNLALVYDEMRDYAKAEPLYQEALATKTKVLGREHADTVTTMYNLAGLYERVGDYAKAEPLYKEVLQIREKLFGSDSPKTAAVMNDLAFLYVAMGAFSKAEPFYQKALQINKSALGQDNSVTATSFDNLASLYQDIGDYNKAEPLFSQAVQIRKKLFGLDHRDTARSIGNLGLLYSDMSDYPRAEPLLRQALQIREKVLGPEDPDTAAALSNLGGLYKRKGDYLQALPLVQQALQINAKVLGTEHPATITSLSNLGLLYEDMGDYANAESLLQQVVQVRKRVLGAEHPDTAAADGNLGFFYQGLGDYAKAEALLNEALEVDEKVLGLEHPETARSLGNLGTLFEAKFDYARAEPLLRQALETNTTLFGSEHPVTVVNLNNLAYLYLIEGNYPQAENLYRQALEVREKILGPDHPDTAVSEHNLGLLYEFTGEFGKAEPLFRKAWQTETKTLGPEHQTMVTALEDLACLKFDLREFDEARNLAILSDKSHSLMFSKILAFTSEQQRLAYQDTVKANLYGLFALLSGCEDHLASAVLRFKGIALDSIIEDRLMAVGSKGSEQQKLLDQIANDRDELGQLLWQTCETSSSAPTQRANELEQEVEQIEGRLASQAGSPGSVRRALSVTLEQVQNAIPKDSALVEYLNCPCYLGKGKVEVRYGAIVLVPNGQVHWIPLGAADGIDALVNRYQRLVREPADAEELSANLENLYRTVFAPICFVLPSGTKRIIISPDGELNFISFATLLNPEKQFVAELYRIQYIASGRDLLREVKTVTDSQVVVFADPDFELSITKAVVPASSLSSTDGNALPGNEKRGIEELTFGPLPGTRKESDALIPRFKGWKWKVRDPMMGKDATKEALLRIHSPYILHLATHGFLESKHDLAVPVTPQYIGFANRMKNSKFFENPMHRSGLALAGAQATLEAWMRGEAPPRANDGILTAEDVSALDLKGTWLVCLSACDTGSGEVKAGEGVMGLRRGFIEAGTENLLMTLWSVSDEATVQIMSDFYEAAHQSGDAPEALAEVQRTWLLKLREKHGLAQAVNLAGPFIMTSQGKP